MIILIFAMDNFMNNRLPYSYVKSEEKKFLSDLSCQDYGQNIFGLFSKKSEVNSSLCAF